jgi:2'-5' RNA ligase
MEAEVAVNYRLFVCIELVDRDRAILGDLQSRLRRTAARVSWVPPTNIHLTISFLGDVSSARVDELKRALDLASSGAEAIHLRIEGTGAFPSLARPRVFWAGVRGDVDALATLQRRVARELTTLGFRGDAKPFSPHLTLGRVKDDRDPALREVLALLSSEALVCESFPVTDIILMKSDLDPRGARYTPLHRTPLLG